MMSVMVRMVVVVVLPAVSPVVLPAFVRIVKAPVPMMHRMAVLPFVPVLRILVRIHDFDLSVCFGSFVCRKKLSQFS